MTAKKTGPKLSIHHVLTRERVAYYLDHVVEFIEDFVFFKRAKKYGGTLNLTWQQNEMIEDIWNNRHTSFRAGKGIGKSTTIALVTIAFMALHNEPKVVITSPSFEQMKSTLWPEISKWIKRSALSDFFVQTAKRLYLRHDPKNSFAVLRTAAKAEGLQGLHTKNMLLFIDEASGVQDSSFDAFMSTMTGANNKIVLMSNPTLSSGFFFDTHNKNAKHWVTRKYNSEESEIVDLEWLEGMRAKYISNGIVSDVYKASVLGDFPTGDPNSLISFEEVSRATMRTVDRGAPVEIGVDVARKGDDLTCICVREGYYVHPLIKAAKNTVPMTIELVIKTVKKIRFETGYAGVIRVKVDDSGVGGGVTDGLDLDRENNIEVVPCNFGGAGNKTYENEASIMWGELKSVIDFISLPNDNNLKEEICTRWWHLSAKGRIKIESKDDFKRRYGGSPDNADALVLAFARKSNEHRFIKSFDYADDNIACVSQEALVRNRRYASLFVNSSGICSAVFSSIDDGKLLVFDEFSGDTSDMITVINYWAPYEKIMANKRFFSKESEDLFLKFMASSIYLIEAYSYNDLGSIHHLEQLAKNNGLFVSKECSVLKNQIRGWTTSVKKSDLDNNFGFCYALAQMVSELNVINAISLNCI